MRVGARSERSAVLLVCLAAAASCKSVETTGLVVEVHAEGLQAGTDLDAVVATVDGNAPTTFSLAPTVGDGKVAFPFRFGLVPGKTSGETAAVELVGRWQGVDKLRTSARVGFVKGEVRLLVLTLARACVDVSLSCPGGETCLGGACGSNRVDAIGLPPVGPLPVEVPDAAADIGPDAAADIDPDAAMDGRPPTDTPAAAPEVGPDGPACTEGEARDCTCGAGTGHRTCTGGAWGPCSTACDRAGLFGPCAKGVVLCTGGQWGACSIARGTRDTCEKGNDNDCDGKANGNQDCRCIVGETRSCAAGGWLGKCATGTETCTADGWVCNIKASPDTCEKGNDNNCNGTPSDGCECSPGDPPRKCLAPGACGQGTQSCSATGKWNPCSIAPKTVDGCEPGNDDNCNGKANDSQPRLRVPERHHREQRLQLLRGPADLHGRKVGPVPRLRLRPGYHRGQRLQRLRRQAVLRRRSQAGPVSRVRLRPGHHGALRLQRLRRQALVRGRLQAGRLSRLRLRARHRRADRLQCLRRQARLRPGPEVRSLPRLRLRPRRHRGDGLQQLRRQAHLR